MTSTRPFLIYQIDYYSIERGKLIPASKRQIRWRFGFANMSALSNGEVGTACRGEEHDVTFIWSITSGKRTILFDGHEVHFSVNRMGLFDHSWTMKNNHVLKIVAHASPPLSPTPGFRQYDFFVDGQSFFSFPKVYRLGMSPNDPRAVAPSSTGVAPPRRSTFAGSDRIASLEMPSNPDEEEAYLQEAIRQSLEDEKVKTGASGGGDLLDFGPDVVPTQPVLALPPSTAATWAAAPVDPFSASPASAPSQSTPDAWNSALTPVAIAANPWDVAPGPPAADPWGSAPALAADPWSASTAPSSVMPASNPYGTTPSQAQTTPANPYTSTPSANGYGYGGQSYGSSQYQSASNAPAPLMQNAEAQQYGYPMSGQPSYSHSAPAPYTSQAPAPPGAWTAPPAILTSTSSDGQDVPSSVTPLAQQTPSSLGFGSPAPTFSGFSPTPVKQRQPAQEQAPAYQVDVPNEFVESADSRPSSLVDQTFAKLINVDSFSITSKKDEPTANPFTSTSINDNRSLADIQKTKAPLSKEIMKSYQPTSMVVSSQQNNYGSQYGIQQGGQQTQSNYIQQHSLPFGHPTHQPYQQPQYGQQPNVPQYGQTPPVSQFQYGQSGAAPEYGQQPQYLQQQHQFTQQQQQQGMYGQQPVAPQGFNF